jgi:hypothetical protein
MGGLVVLGWLEQAAQQAKQSSIGARAALVICNVQQLELASTASNCTFGAAAGAATVDARPAGTCCMQS